MEPKNIGILINIIGSVCINLGNNLQSSGHRKRSLAQNVAQDAAHASKFVDSSNGSPVGRELGIRDTGDVELAFTPRPLAPSDHVFVSSSQGSRLPLDGSIEDNEMDEKAPFLEGSPETTAGSGGRTNSTNSGGESELRLIVKQLALKADSLRKNFCTCKHCSHWWSPSSSGNSSTKCNGTPACLRVEPTWALGSAVFFAGTCAVFVSYSFAPQSLLAPLGAAQFVTNVVFAKLIHGAPVTRRAVGATAVIVLGLGLVVCFSPHNASDSGGEEQRVVAEVADSNSMDSSSGSSISGSSSNPTTAHTALGLKRMRELYSYSAYQLYIASVTSLAALLNLVYRTYSAALSEGRPLPLDPFVRPLAYSVVSAALGTQSTLQAKCLSELASALDPSALTDSLTYLTLFGFVGGTAFWLYRMNEALALFEPLFIIPVLQVFWTFFATLNGGIFFREFMQPAFLQRGVGGFVLGVCVIFSGVYFLAPPPPPSSSSSGVATAASNFGDVTGDVYDASRSSSCSSSSDSKSISSRNISSSSIDSSSTAAGEGGSEGHHSASSSRSTSSPSTAATSGSSSADLRNCDSSGSGSNSINYDNSSTSAYSIRSSSSSGGASDANSSSARKHGAHVGLRARAPSGEHSSDEVTDT